MKTQVKSIAVDQLQDISLSDADIHLVFAPRTAMEDGQLPRIFKERTKDDVIFVSTAGQICGYGVCENKVTITSIKLENSRLKTISMNIERYQDYAQVGMDLFNSLNEESLQGIMVFSDGITVNGSDLRKGLERENKGRVPITGGLVGDGAAFQKTLTGINEAREGNVVGIGFYGEKIHLGYGSRGGWQFKRQMNIISDSEGNVLKEINGTPALDFYKNKLNGKLKSLPSDALKFPLMVSDVYSNQQLVRTILSVDEESKTMTFAGDMPLASGVQFLEATDEQLIEGAKSAAMVTQGRMKDKKADLALLVSCVGRKLVLNGRITEEVSAVREVLGEDTQVAGFYSYGELSPSEVSGKCELMNQTMTIITLTEDK